MLLSDWQVSGVVTLQSGRPFTVSLLQEIDNSNTGRANLGFGYNDRPNVVGDPALVRSDRRALVRHERVCVPGLRDLRQLGPQHRRRARLSERQPGVDEAAAAGRRSKLQLRLEAFNLFNHTNFNQPDNFLGSPTFGQILSAQSPRRFQLGAKVIF